MLKQVFDLNCGVVSDARKLRGEHLNDPLGVTNAVEEIRIAKRNVPRAGRNLRPHVREDNVCGNHSKSAVVNWNDRTMTATVFTAAAGFGVSNGSPFAGDLQCGIPRKRRQSLP